MREVNMGWLSKYIEFTSIDLFAPNVVTADLIVQHQEVFVGLVMPFRTADEASLDCMDGLEYGLAHGTLLAWCTKARLSVADLKVTLTTPHGSYALKGNEDLLIFLVGNITNKLQILDFMRKHKPGAI
jgi:hypothetical protein